MKNKNAGLLIIGIGILIVIVVLIFNIGMRNIVSQSCGHGTGCPMYGTINFQTYISLAIAAFVFFLGVFFYSPSLKKELLLKKKKLKCLLRKKSWI